MSEVKFNINFSDQSSVIVTGDSIIFPIGFNDEKKAVAGKPINLAEYSDHHQELALIIMEILIQFEFFTIDDDLLTRTTIYKSNSVVSIKKQHKIKSKTF